MSSPKVLEVDSQRTAIISIIILKPEDPFLAFLKKHSIFIPKNEIFPI